ncbi:DUF6636 domain-containing protein [Loktanella sp. Alg231-35]|uniref:DUF6636 domain-containing protein n=1 Tax=Loktanella sp. Alg231-35 TaxID=1922220 RepID=UPI000D5504B6|nr:DUF6636 domain-containing protein [Loktanella sp. Alg231-35]
MRTIYLSLLLWIIASPVTAAEISFTSPSGNIRCQIQDTVVANARCDLDVTRQSFTERPASCDGVWGTSFAVLLTGPGIVNCATRTIARDGVATILPYGASISFAGIICRSEEVGMICTNEDGGGFSIRRAEQRVY